MARLNIRYWFLGLVLTAVLPMAALIVHSGLDYADHLRQDALESARRNAESLAGVQERITDGTRQILATLAVLPEVRSCDPRHCDGLLARVLAQNPLYANILRTDAQGKVQMAPRALAGDYLGDRKHFREAIASGSFAAGEYILSRTNGEAVFPFCMPLKNDDGSVYGMLSVGVRLTSYAALFDKLGLPRGATLSITDHIGIRLFHHPESPSMPLGRQIHAEAMEQVNTGGDSGSLLMTGQDGVRRLYAYKKLRLPDAREPYMILFLGIPEAEATTPAQASMWRDLRTLALVALLALTLAWLAADTQLGRPLRTLAQMAQRIESGDLSARANLSRQPGELAQVAQAMNRMAEGLQAREAERGEAEAQTLRSLQEKETLLREIHHRVKNNLQLVLSLLRLQGQRPEGPDGQVALENRVRAMSLVHEQLYGSLDLSGVDLAEYVPRLAGLVARASAPAGTRLDVRAEAVSLDIDRAVPFGLLLNELLTNACKHGLKPEGTLRVNLRREGCEAVLDVADDGGGLPEGFDPAATQTLGAQLVSALAEQLGGSLSWENAPGARFILRFALERG